MITPRQFEERVAEIKTEYSSDQETMMYLLFALMADTLETWGYKVDDVRQAAKDRR